MQIMFVDLSRALTYMHAMYRIYLRLFPYHEDTIPRELDPSPSTTFSAPVVLT